MTEEKAIEVIRDNCYIVDLLDIDRIVEVNTALDLAIKALRKVGTATNIDTLISRFRELQLKHEHKTDQSYQQGVTDCLRILLEECDSIIMDGGGTS